MISTFIQALIVAVIPLGSIDTRVGTAPSETAAAGTFGRNTEELGQTLPAVAAPHGMTLWTPQTRDTEHKCVAPYYFNDTRFQGFRASHWIVGGCTQDYGSFTVMPMTGKLRTRPDHRETPFSHDDETATPHLYAVNLPQEGVRAEMTGTSRSAIMRFVCERPGDFFLVVNPNSDEGQGSVSINPSLATVTASNPVHRIYQGKGEPAGFAGHFFLRVSRQPVDWGVSHGDTILAGVTTLDHVPEAAAWMRFEVQAGDTILARCATSFVDGDGALANLCREIPTWDFDGTRDNLASTWQRHLGTVEVHGGDSAMFYGAMYRASLLPRVVSDVDGRHVAFGGSGEIITLPKGREYYDDYSMWDTYRALHPFLLITSPSRSGQMMQSLVDKGRQGGRLPIFPCWNSYTAAMIGDHCIAAIAEAWRKGVRNFDIKEAYRLMRLNAFSTPDSAAYVDGRGRRALDSYLRLGYVPMEDTVPWAYHRREQVSRTLEYAYDDYCLSLIARDLGFREDADTLSRRAANWRNVIHPTSGHALGRRANGSWLTGIEANPFTFQKYITEGAPCHYSWYVPHDIPGLIEHTGGMRRFGARLDALFDNNLYWHGNEPCHQIAWLAALAGQPWKTRQRVRHILATEYLNKPGGLSGNDDAGQMSAWYLFAAMGFYPVNPAGGVYVIGSPTFERTTLHLENGRTFTIEAPGASPEAIYISSITLNDIPLTRPVITHDEIMAGGILRCVMTADPSLDCGHTTL